MAKYINYALFILYCVTTSYCAVVRLFDAVGHGEEQVEYEIQDDDKQCHNIGEHWFNRVSSVKVGNLCLKFYADLNCAGDRSIKLYPGNFAYAHYNLVAWNFNDVIKSFKVCQKLKNNVNYASDVDIVSFFTEPDKKGDHFNINVNFCTNLAENRRKTASSLMTYNRCYVFYSGLNCAGKSLKAGYNLSTNLDKQIMSIDNCRPNQLYDFIYPEGDTVVTSTEMENLDTTVSTDATVLTTEKTDIFDTKTIIVSVMVPVFLLLLLIGISLLILFIYVRKTSQNQTQIQSNSLSMEETERDFLGQKFIQHFLNGNPLAFEQISFETADTDYKANNLPYDAATFEIPLEYILIDSKCPLGSGNFGIVSKGIVSSPRFSKPVEVAVKTLKADADPAYIATLLKELKIMMYLQLKQGNIKNPHIVNLVGACTERIRELQPYIMLELCSNGSLDVYLKKKRKTFVDLLKDNSNVPTPRRSSHFYENSQINTLILLKWSKNIANGMEFLSANKVVHGDLAARNILLDGSLTAKICDFGLSKQLYNYTQYLKKKQAPVPWKWMAIESLRDLSFSTKSDVWSYGITIWEIFSLAINPYPGVQYSPEFLTKLSNGYRMDSPAYAPSEIYHLMLRCWSTDPDERPSYYEIQNVISLVLEKWFPN